MAKLKRETVKALALQLPDKGKALADLLKEMGHEIEAAAPKKGAYVKPGDIVICGNGKFRNMVISPEEYMRIYGEELREKCLAVVHLEGRMRRPYYTPTYRFPGIYTDDGKPVLGYA